MQILYLNNYIRTIIISYLANRVMNQFDKIISCMINVLNTKTEIM